MGVYSYEIVTNSPVAADKLFKTATDNEILGKALPQVFKNVEIIEGDGAAGTIRQLNFAEGLPIKPAKEIIEVYDKQNKIMKYSIIEGDMLMGGKIEKITNEIKLEPSSDGGSLCKFTSTYYTVGDFEVSQEELNSNKEKYNGLFKALEGYISANPDY